MFSDIDAAWAGKKVEFISGRHKGKRGICNGFRNAYGGAGLQIQTENNEYIMVYSRDLDDIRKLETTDNL